MEFFENKESLESKVHVLPMVKIDYAGKANIDHYFF